MAHADVAEGVDDAFVGDDAVGEREFRAGFGKTIGHRRFPVKTWLMVCPIIGQREAAFRLVFCATVTIARAVFARGISMHAEIDLYKHG